MATALRSELEAIAGTSLALQPRSTPAGIPTGIPALDPVPRGSLTEICGPASSDAPACRLLMAEITAREEVCASSIPPAPPIPPPRAHAGAPRSSLDPLRGMPNAR